MIDFEKINASYFCDGFYSLQLEVGDVCHQNCIYCYMNALPEKNNELSDPIVRDILKDSYLLGITAIEWLGGEPLLRDDIFEHMALAHDLGLRNNIWTGGVPFEDHSTVRQSARYATPGLISVHLSTVNRELYCQMHPGRSADDIDTILNGVKELLNLGYSPENMLNSVTFTGLQPVEDMIETIDYFEGHFSIKTSLNVYHTYLRPEANNHDLERFIPDKKDMAKVYKRYNKQWGAQNYPMNCVNKQYCSTTLAVLNNGNVTPCATIRDETAGNVNGADSFREIVKRNRDFLCFKHFKQKENLPDECRNCAITDECWGCRSRAFAAGTGIYGRDPRCFRSA